MADNNKEMSNTMEINSIIQDVRTRLYPEPERTDEKDTDIFRRVTVAPQEDTADDYVFVEENGAVGSDPAKDAARNVSKQSSRGDRQKNRSGKPLIITLIAVAVLLAAVLTGIIVWRLSEKTPPASLEEVAADVTYSAGTVVNGVNIGGMNVAQAKEALAPAEQKLADAIRIEVSAGEKKVTLTKDDFTYSFNTDEVLKAALENTAATDSTVATASAAFEIRMTVDENSYPAAAQKVASQVNTEPKDASVKSFEPDMETMFTYQKEQSGVKVKTDELVKQIAAIFASGKTDGSIQAPVEEQKPKITEDSLKKNIKKLSAFSTYSTNTSNAMSNQALSLKACSGSIIEPDAVWSFNNCTGDSNLESNGYLPAGVIIEGRHEIGIGGGICQSSTTIYNAGILAGMDIVERECHYYPSSYVDYGRDATIDYGNIDLKLRNPYQYQLFLKCWMDGAELNAEIYGLEPADFDEVKISISNPAYFTNGFTVTGSRTYYKDGKTVRTDKLPSSTYYFSAPNSGEDNSPTTAPTTAPVPTSSDTTPPAPEPTPTELEPTPIDPVPSDPTAGDPGTDDPTPSDPTSGDPGTDDPTPSDPGTDDPVPSDPTAGDSGADTPGSADLTEPDAAD